MRQRQDAVAVNLLIMRHGAGDDGEARVNTTEERLDLDHIRHLPRGSEEFVECARFGLIERNAKRDLDGVAESRPVYGRPLPLQHAGGLQPL